MKKQLAMHFTAKRRPWNKGKKLRNFGSVSAHKRRVNPRRRRKARGRRRRSNPTQVLLANPQRRRRRRVRHASHVRTHVTRSNPSRGRRRRRSVRHIMRSHGIRRRANPINLNLKSAGTIFRYALFGGAGVMAARMAGTFYSRHIASFVLGDAANDSKSWRQIANEAVRLAFMAAATILANRALKSVRLISEGDRQMLLAGGLAETGRQAIGVALQRVSPGFDRGRVGLDGPDEDGMLDESGRVWVLRGGEYHLLEGVEDAEAFAGVEDAQEFAGGFN